MATDESDLPPVPPSADLKTSRAEDFACELVEIEGWQVSVTSYRITGHYVCKVDNVDPGAVIARATAPTKTAAVEAACKKAAARLKRTVRHR